MEKFKSDKYRFSTTAPALFAISNEINYERKKQIEKFINSLYEYKILLKDLISLEPNIKQRNNILNLAFYIIEDFNILEILERDKEIPINELRKKTLVSKKFIETWNDYIIAYTLILGNSDYKLIKDYMRIVEEEEENDDKVISLDSERDLFKGLVLSKNKKSIFIITSTGEFKKIKNSFEDDFEVGSEGTGFKSKGIKYYKKYILIFLGIFIILGFIFINKYKEVDRTVLLKSTSTIKIQVNSFDRVLSMHSNTSKGKELVSNINGLNQNFDKVLKEVLEYANNNNMIPDKRILISITGEPIKYGSLEETGKYILENKIYLVVNNVGIEHKLYEIMKKNTKENKN